VGWELFLVNSYISLLNSSGDNFVYSGEGISDILSINLLLKISCVKSGSSAKIESVGE